MQEGVRRGKKKQMVERDNDEERKRLKESTVVVKERRMRKRGGRRWFVGVLRCVCVCVYTRAASHTVSTKTEYLDLECLHLLNTHTISVSFLQCIPFFNLKVVFSLLF